MKKSILLFLALLLPGLIFVFLKYTGKNEFSIPVFHEQGVLTAPPECGLNYPAPYHINDSILGAMGIVQSANLLVFPEDQLEYHKLENALKDEFQNDSFIIVQASKVSDDTSRINQLRKCIFLLHQPNQSVLVDKAGRIRGYYDLTEREEIDRLRVEMKILLNKY